jgi:hypothetical protein
MPFSTYKEAVVKLRQFLNDVPQLNTLDQEMENTDDELEDYIKDAINDINFGYEPKTNFALVDIVVEPGVDGGRISWTTVKLGAILQLLMAKGIISARNAITYSDAGGVTVAEMDKYGRYLQYFNQLSARYERQVQQVKTRYNIEQAYGGVNSPMGFDFYYG